MQLFSTNFAHSCSLFLGKFVEHFVYFEIDRRKEKIHIGILYYIVYPGNILVSASIVYTLQSMR